VRYHARRQAFFDRWRRITSATSVIFGSAAAADLLHDGGHLLAVAAAFVVAVFSAADLVVGTAEMARKHDDLRRRFIKLEAKMLANEQPDPGTVSDWCGERLDIESDEPPSYKALDLLCENEQAIATGTKRSVRLTWWQVRTAHWKRWENLTPKLTELET
jgi:hypothetical protein